MSTDERNQLKIDLLRMAADIIDEDFRENVNGEAISDYADAIITARGYGMYRASGILRQMAAVLEPEREDHE